jgi:hypothetical protein
MTKQRTFGERFAIDARRSVRDADPDDMVEVGRYPADTHKITRDDETGEWVIFGPESQQPDQESDRDTTEGLGDRRARDHRQPIRSLKDLNQLFARHYRSRRDNRSDEEVVIHNHIRDR